jgi:hypothetical protein
MVLEYAGLMAKSRELRENGKINEANELVARANDLMTFKGGAGAAAAERNDITAIKNEQTALLKELENPVLPKDVRAAKQKQLDETYVKLRTLYGIPSGAGGGGSKIGEVDKSNPLLK